MPFTPFGFSSPGGAAGGALTGTYPNPGLSPAAVAGAQNWTWLPADNGLLMATTDPDVTPNNLITVGGTLYLRKLTARSAVTVSTLWFIMITAGSGASSGSFAGLYNSAGTLLTGSADIGATLTGAAGGISVALTSAQALTAGQFVWAAFLTNLATTQPTLQRESSSLSAPNVNLTAANFRSAANGTLLAALPASITPASNTVTGSIPLWVGAA